MDQGLSAFLAEIARQKINLFGINIHQHGALAAQHYFAPDEPRNIYSVSKSFAATAIGILIDEGRLHLEDRPIDFFPEHLPDYLCAGYEKLNLHHLLMMSSGHSRGLLLEDERSNLTETDWIRFVFSQPLVSQPGERFMYSNGSSYLAGCMAEKAAGSKLIDFIYERMFKTMNIPYPVWDECPMGHTFAASRLRLKLSDMMKLGVLYLKSGQYQAAQIISKHWVNTATKRKIASAGSVLDEGHGYGYQFWMCRHPGIYLAYGLKGQFIIVVPQKEAVIATSADDERSQKLLNIIWDTILPNL